MLMTRVVLHHWRWHRWLQWCGRHRFLCLLSDCLSFVRCLLLLSFACAVAIDCPRRAGAAGSAVLRAVAVRPDEEDVLAAELLEDLVGLGARDAGKLPA